MAANEARVMSLERAPKSSQIHCSHSSSSSINESVTAHTADEANPTNAVPEPLGSYYSPWSPDGYNSDANSSHSQSPSSKSKSNSISFSYEELEIGQFYMKQEAAKKSQKYNMRPSLPSPVTNDQKDNHYDDEAMDRILINYRNQESLSKDTRRGIRRVDTVQTAVRQKQLPVQTHIAPFRRESETDDAVPNMKDFNSEPANDQHGKEQEVLIYGSMSGILRRARSRSSPDFDLCETQSTYLQSIPVSDELFWGYMNPQLSEDAFAVEAEFDSGSDYDQDEEEKEDSPGPGPPTIDQKQTQLAIQRTTQLLMVSSGESKEIFQSLWKICISLKKDPIYHVSYDDKLLQHDHVEGFLKLLGFVKDELSFRWSCFAYAPHQKSLIDIAIIECHKCRQIIRQRRSTIELVNQHKKQRNRIKTQRPKLNINVNAQSITNENEKDSSDSIQVYELIWGITHDNNVDPDARDVLLLCYPLITNTEYILYFLQARFFKDDNDETITLHDGDNTTKYDKILSSFSVQANVIAFIKHWMVRFWEKDWDSNPNLISFCMMFLERIRSAYQSQENQQHYDPLDISFQGLGLVKVLENTIKTQKSQMRVNKILGDNSENHGLPSSEKYGNGKTPKKISSILARPFSHQKLNKEPKNFMNVDYVIIAEQITMLQFRIFKRIHPRECLKQAWKKKKTKRKFAPNITQYIDAFNQLTKWIQSTILSVEYVKSRGKTIKKWIKVEEELLKLRNLQALCAVHCGLASTPIFRLKEAWSYVPKKYITLHEEIHVIMKSTGNWRNLRSLQLQTHPPMLPYFGMFAQDMIAIEETTNNRSKDGIINWDALCRGQAAIDEYLIYQNTPYNNLNTDLSIQRWMNKELRMSGKLDDEYVYQVSDYIVSNDKRGNPFFS